MKRTYRFDKPLLERLREHHNLNTPQTHTMQEAADEIERLRAEIEKLRERIERQLADYGILAREYLRVTTPDLITGSESTNE